MAAMVCLVGMTRDAGATVTFSLVWTSSSAAATGLGTNSITTSPGSTIQLNLVMTTNQTLGGHGVSINFDTDLVDELNILGYGAWAGLTFGTTTMATQYSLIGTGAGPATESTGSVGGRIRTFESGVLSGPLFLPTGTYVIGTARFVTTGNLASDGLDLFTGLFNVGVDDVLDNTNSVIPSSGLVFNSGSVNVIPEPGTVSLLGLGLVGLVLAGRRSRRS
jgi:hypothetical protein